MCKSIGDKAPQLHPLQVALKRNWERIIRENGVKQDWLALEVGVDKSRISRWKNPEEMEFPNTPHMARLVEALQQWPGVSASDPIEGFNHYFGCAVLRRNQYESNEVDAKTLGRIGSIMSLKYGKTGALIFQVLEDGRIDEDEIGDLIDAEQDVASLVTVLNDLHARIVEAKRKRLGGLAS